MSADLERDLGAWARGELARERLFATHGAEAAGSVALHERLTEMAAGSAIPAADAGWAALAVKLDAPAPVVPLRRHHRRRRTVSILVAAALVMAGSAFAAIVGTSRHGAPSPSTGTTFTAPGPNSVGRPNDRRLAPPPSAPGTTHPQPDGSGPSSDGGSGTTDRGSGAGDGGNTGGGDGSTSTDDPRDRDHGTGNDGSHDDHGSGNNGPSGTLPHGSNGH